MGSDLERWGGGVEWGQTQSGREEMWSGVALGVVGEVKQGQTQSSGGGGAQGQMQGSIPGPPLHHS